ncbi:MAG TPA: DMT family transporter [Gammaproteobacteria bacterium]
MPDKDISRHFPIKTFVLTALALIAFAANSVLCRLALGGNSIDAASFTVIRLLAGAITLALILCIARKRKNPFMGGRWPAAFMLFLYAITFSYAYVSLDTGTGALILFGSVQITMILAGLLSGVRLHMIEWAGVLIAFGGFVYLVLPGVTAPSMSGFLLMTLAGIAWGMYTLKGKDSRDPLADTAGNFVQTLPFIIVLAFVTVKQTQFSTPGVIYAVLSGAIASGLGYTIWYTALGGLSGTLAAVVQLLVPVIAAAGGVLFMSEVVSLRLTLSAILVLGGILMVTLGRSHVKKSVNAIAPD